MERDHMRNQTNAEINLLARYYRFGPGDAVRKLGRHWVLECDAWSYPGVFATRHEAIAQLRLCVDYLERFTRPGVEDPEAEARRRLLSTPDSAFPGPSQTTVK